VNLEFLFYNFKTECAAFYLQQFITHPTQGFQKKYVKYLFLPRFNDSDSKYLNEQILIWTIRALYLIYFITFSIQLIGETLHTIIADLKEKTFSLSFIIMVNIVYVVVNTIYFVEYIKLLFAKRLFSGDPVSSTEQFDLWIKMAENQKNIYVLNGLLTILLIIKLLQMIKSLFYTSLTIVFATFSAISSLLIAFFSTVGLLMLLYVAVALLLMGNYVQAYGDLGSTLEQVILSLFQDSPSDSLSFIDYKQDSMIPSMYFYILFLTFNTFLLQFFIAIIVSSYSELRNRYQLEIEMNSRFESTKGLKMSDKLKCLLTFTPYNPDSKKIKEVDEFKTEMQRDVMMETARIDELGRGNGQPLHRALKSKSTQGASNQGHTETGTEFMTKVKSIENSFETYEEKSKQVKKPIKQKMREVLSMNLELLGLHGKQNTELISRDQYLTKLKKIGVQIVRERNKEINVIIHETTSSILGNFFKFTLYLLYCLVFYWVVSENLNMYEAYRISSAFQLGVESEQFQPTKYADTITFFNCSTLSEFNDWFTMIMTKFPSKLTDPKRVISSFNYQIFVTNGLLIYDKVYRTDKIMVGYTYLESAQHQWK
jgi:hypothetical protein